jgi:hypothetical protein
MKTVITDVKRVDALNENKPLYDACTCVCGCMFEVGQVGM